MKVDQIEHENTRARVLENHLKNCLDWGERNDYPQSVVDILNASFTGTACLDQYKKFIYGQGFAESSIYQMVINDEGESLDSLLSLVASDYATFGGFALHFNQNLLGQIVNIHYIPFENVRLCSDDDKNYAGKVAIHPDWGLRSYKRFGATPIEYFDLWTPSYYDFKEKVDEAGGILEYKGQVFYYSNRRGEYPLPIFDSVLTDMSTQEAISNITYRNARRGFLPAGCFAEINEYYDDNEPNDKAAFDMVSENLRQMQGDKNASAIMHVVVKSKEEVPQMISLKGDNYDKEYEASREAIKQNIGQAFRQPHELRCDENASGFATDTMIQAYKVYNSMTQLERQTIEREFVRIFKQWHIAMEYNFEIKPLAYGSETILSRLGDTTAQEAVTLATNTAIPVEQRKAILMQVYGMQENEANDILLIQTTQDNADNN